MLKHINDYILYEIRTELFELDGKTIKSAEMISNYKNDAQLITLDNGNQYILRTVVLRDEEDRAISRQMVLHKILRKKTKSDFLEEELKKVKYLLEMHKEQMDFHKMSLSRTEKELKKLKEKL